MRGLVPVLSLAALSACGNLGKIEGPALDRFAFPAGLAHVTVPGKTNGVLLVANANGDKRYTAGSIVAVDLDALTDLPQLGSAPYAVKNISDLHLTESQRAVIGSFAGELHLSEVRAGEWRAYVPTRAEDNGLYRVKLTMEGTTPKLSCIGGASGDGQNCVPTGISMTPDFLAKTTSGLPRAPQPFGVTSLVRACTNAIDCCPAGATDLCGRTCQANACVGKDGAPYSDLWVTHIAAADSPPQSGTNYVSYLVHIDSDDFTIGETNYVSIGFGASNSAVALGRWVYVTGRLATTAPNLLRLVRSDSRYDFYTVYEVASEAAVRVADSRAIALSSDKTRLYMLGRLPDSIIFGEIQGGDGYSPAVPLTKQVPTIDAVIDLKVIPRVGKGDLLVISGGTSLGQLAIYDTDSGQHAAIVKGIGAQPSNVTVDVRGNSARIFTSNFGDGRISVVDIDDLDRPQDARLVAFLGKQQVCLVLGEKSPNCRALAVEDR